MNATHSPGATSLSALFDELGHVAACAHTLSVVILQADEHARDGQDLLERARPSVRDLGRAFAQVHNGNVFNIDLDSELDWTLACAYDFVCAIERDLGSAPVPGLGRGYAVGHAQADIRELRSAVRVAQQRVIALRAALPAESADAAPGQEQSRITVFRPSVCLAAWSARLLPPADRPRYDEEFRNELYDLAAAGAARRAQVGHAVLLLACAWRLRGELRRPRTNRAVS